MTESVLSARDAVVVKQQSRQTNQQDFKWWGRGGYWEVEVSWERCVCVMKTNWAALGEAIFDVVVGKGLFLRRDIRLPAMQMGKHTWGTGLAEALNNWESVWHV